MQLQPLLHDVDESLCLARAAFGNDPEAVNIWIGDERSVSSVHKDHYGSVLNFNESHSHSRVRVCGPS